MDVSRRRAGVKSSVVAGSVWESRMKAFNAADTPNPDSPRKTIVRKPPIPSTGKRKTWKSESFDGNLEIGKKVEQQSKDSGAATASDGVSRRIPIQPKKGRSDAAIDKKKTPIQIPESRSDVNEDVELDSVDKDIGTEKQDPEMEIEKDVTRFEDQNSAKENEENGSEGLCKEFGVCQEQIVSSNNEEDEEEEEDEEIEIEEVEIEKKVVTKSAKEEEDKPRKVELREQKPNKNTEIAEKRVYQLRNRTATPTCSSYKQPPPVMRRAEIYQNLSKSTKPTSFAGPVKNEFQNFQERHSKLQNLVDLVMWRDISRSAFVFGMGTFIIISSSYTHDLNVSFISVISYLGLVYLAAIFLYRSLICRGIMDTNDSINYVVGEEEAVWLMKLFLPYLNESLLKIKALFSGDPATTMKMAVVLFVLARCGSSITIWKMTKLGFFGVFVVPKVCSSYSQQLTAYAKFWIRRFRDAWESCSHKKAVALAIFTLVWNLSSMLARLWAVFMMFVAVRYYQQSMESDDWVEAEEESAADFEEQPQINKLKKGC